MNYGIICIYIYISYGIELRKLRPEKNDNIGPRQQNCILFDKDVAKVFFENFGWLYKKCRTLGGWPKYSDKDVAKVSRVFWPTTQGSTLLIKQTIIFKKYVFHF
jgi:hypothetical protein